MSFLSRTLKHSKSSFSSLYTLSLRSFCVQQQAVRHFNYSDLDFKENPNRTTKPDFSKISWGTQFTDHLLEIDWNKKTGWTNPTIRSFDDFRIHPAASVLHYSMEAYEGLKAYLDEDKNIRLFRPDENMERMLLSCEALYFPDFDKDEFIRCIGRLIYEDRQFIPNKPGYSLYIRPTVISTHRHLGIAPSDDIKLYCILSPVGSYYPKGFKAISLLAETEYCRSWPGGPGNRKLGGNYGHTVKTAEKAKAQGYTQVLWLYDRKQITEVGTMNFFVFWINKNTNRPELITAPLDGLSLPGVTRKSVLELCRQWGEFDVTDDRPFTIDDILEAQADNRLIEMFGSGTAAIVCPINKLAYEDKPYMIPNGNEKVFKTKNNPKYDFEIPEFAKQENIQENEKPGPLCKRLYKTITDIQYGRGEYKNHKWSWVIGKDIDIKQ